MEHKNIVFLHAFPLNSKMWKYQAENLREFNIYLIDYQNLLKENLKDFADFVYQFLNENKIKRAIFVGLSMGGYIIFQMVRYYKNFIKGIVLANTKASADSLELRNKRFELIKRIENEGIEFLIDEYLEKFLKNRNKEKEEMIRNMILEAKKESLISSLKALANRESSIEILKEIEVPTLIISSTDDTLTTIEDAKIMNKYIKNSKLIIFENCAHLSNLEYPEKFNNVIRNFVYENFS
ncbi:MAG: alpha/beta hydrolase [Candidatus Hydrothermia bacterium]|jgi:3-oxoadipate enol-lactonase|nr:alpha/beta hydrolase [Candidatus Hydrothermia bacterium]